jgi:hypothetical protein
LLKNDPYSKPIVAAVNGDCVGGGLELMLSTDIRAAAPEARFGLTEVKWSIYPFGGSTIKLIAAGARSPGGPFTHWKGAAFPRRTPRRDVTRTGEDRG